MKVYPSKYTISSGDDSLSRIDVYWNFTPQPTFMISCMGNSITMSIDEWFGLQEAMRKLMEDHK